MTRAPLVVVGAGAVGRGVVVPALAHDGRPVVVVTRSPRSVPADERHGATYLPLAERDVVTRALACAALVVVAVQPRDLASVARLLAGGLSFRQRPVDVLVCDNRRHAGAWLRAMVAEHGDDRALAHGYAGALVDRVAVRVAGPGGSRIVTEPYGSVHVEAAALRDPDGPDLAAMGLQPVRDYAAHVLRKLHLFSCGHAATAYLGALRGHERLGDALADPAVAGVVRMALREGQAGVAACYGPEFAGGESFVERCLARYADPAIGDTVARVGRDPLRKLGPHDRILGPARMAGVMGARTPGLAMVAAAAVRAGGPDPVLGPEIASLGVTGVLTRHGRLAEEHPFVRQTARAHAAIGRRGGHALEELLAAPVHRDGADR